MDTKTPKPPEGVGRTSEGSFSLKILIWLAGLLFLLGGIGLIIDIWKFPKSLNSEIPAGAIITIEEKIKNKSAKERHNIKGQEIANLIKTLPKSRVIFSGADYDIEIVSTNPIEGGIEIFARAWYPDGTQIGFGKDGTIDIERFVFANPPIMVEDPNGTIVREWTTQNGTIRQKRLREDPKLAILQSLAHTIKVKQQKAGSENIIFGKTGNTTYTINTDAGTGSTTVDGTVADATGNNATWTDIRALPGDYAAPTSAAEDAWRFIASATTDQWAQLYRAIQVFPTAIITDDDTIDSATFSLNGNSKGDPAAQTPTMSLVLATPAATNTLANGDFAQLKTVKQATDLTYAAMKADNTYSDMTLNATGISNIQKATSTIFGTRATLDLSDATPPVWGSGQSTNWDVDWADTAGTSVDPKLVVETSAAGAGAARKRVIFSY